MTPSIRLAAILPLLLIISLLTACGFQLRGNLDIASEVSRIAVSGTDRGYIRDLIRSLNKNGIQVTELAPYHLRILDIQQETSEQNYSATGVFERQLTLNVTYQLETDDGLPLYTPVEMSNERNITLNQNQSNAAQTEIDLTFKEMRRDMIYNTVRRIAGISGAKLEAEVDRVRSAYQLELQRAAEAEASQ